MSDFHCSSCGKVRRDHFNHHRHDHHHFGHHHDHHDHHHGHHHDHDHHHDHHRDVFCDRFLCDKDFRLRLGGLQGGLNFRMRQLMGCVVKMELEGDRKVKARICFVGSDFVEIEILERLDKKENEEEEVEKKKKKKKRRKKNKKKRKFKGKSWIVPFESVGFVELDDKDCDCDCHH